MEADRHVVPFCALWTDSVIVNCAYAVNDKWRLLLQKVMFQWRSRTLHRFILRVCSLYWVETGRVPESWRLFFSKSPCCATSELYPARTFVWRDANSLSCIFRCSGWLRVPPFLREVSSLSYLVNSTDVPIMLHIALEWLDCSASGEFENTKQKGMPLISMKMPIWRTVCIRFLTWLSWIFYLR